MNNPKFEPGNPTECEVRDCVECKHLMQCAECDDAWTDDTLEDVRILAFVSALVQIGGCSKADEDKFLKTFQIRMNAERAKCSSADIEWVKNAIKLHRAKDRMLNYEVFIGEMLRAIAERKEELDNAEVLDDFEKGRQLAYWEVMDIINTRHEIIQELLEED